MPRTEKTAHTIGTPRFGSEREWLEHVRILAELPYPSIALMPSLMAILRQWVRADMGGFGWADEDLNPIAFMSERMNERAFNWYLRNYHVAFKLFPISDQIESGGDIARRMTESPGFENTDFFREIMQSYGFRWLTLAPVRLCDGVTWGFPNLYRRAEYGQFSDAEQSSFIRATQVLGILDCPDKPLGRLSACERKETGTASLLLRADGGMAARSEKAMQLLYMLWDATMHSLDWAKPDWSALPGVVRTAAQALFDMPESEGWRSLKLSRPCGTFEFSLEKLPDRSAPGESVVMIGIRYSEPIDITVARRLAGWPLSPKEKRIVVASCHNPSHAELADVLGITVNTLKSYNKEMVDRLGVESRQALIAHLLSDEAAAHDVGLRDAGQAP